MITFNRNNFYTNQLQFRGNKKASEQPKPQNKNSSKLMTGVIAASAFVAGLGANQVLTPQETLAKDRFEISMPQPTKSESIEPNTITWAEAAEAAEAKQAPQQTPQAKQTTQNNNRPAKSGILRYYTKTETQNIDGVPHRVVSKYAIKESQYLLNRKIKEIKTGKTVQTEDYDSYVSFPMKTQIKNGANQTIYAEFYDEFSESFKSPTSGKRMWLNDNGDRITTTMYYKRTESLDPEPERNSEFGGLLIGD